MNEQLLSVHEEAGYDEVYPSGYGPKEGSSQSSEREPFAHSPNEKEDFDKKGVKEKEEYDEGKGRMKSMRGKVTGERMRVTEEFLGKEVQEALRMVTLVPSSFS